MRGRDARALAFCCLSTAAIFLILAKLSGSLFVSAGLAFSYGLFVFTRPRMLRIFSRMQGGSDWSGYYWEGERPPGG